MPILETAAASVAAAAAASVVRRPGGPRGRYAVPVVLILLGVWIVADSGLVGAVIP